MVRTATLVINCSIFDCEFGQSPAQGDHAMQALNNNATMTRIIYPKTQNILQANIDNHSLILLQKTEYYKSELEMNPYQNSRATPAAR